MADQVSLAFFVRLDSHSMFCFPAARAAPHPLDHVSTAISIRVLAGTSSEGLYLLSVPRLLLNFLLRSLMR
jgi:hypothetical protein